jgi:two-component system C4-dicarboxylate transport response regulator DctD
MAPPLPRILVVEDDASFRAGVVTSLEHAGYQVEAFARAQPALHAITQQAPDAVLSDLRLPGMDGMELLCRCRAVDAALPVVLMTGHGDVATAVGAIKAGAYDFIEKPFGRERLLTLLGRAVEQGGLRRQNDKLRSRLAATGGLADVLRGHSGAMQSLRTLVLDIAPLPTDVLLLGETGTGKELVARALHDYSERSGPFVAINCAALPESLVESELFGHTAGAFSGAAGAQAGRVEHAHRGTLFLDEMQVMPLVVQAKMLRVLQEREVQRLGSNDVLPLDLRVVAASNRALPELVAQGLFRADLYYRLEGVTLTLPALRERRQDVPGLFEHFATLAAARLQRARPAHNAALGAALMAHDWPGNVRELRSAAQRHVLGLPALQAAPAAAQTGTLGQTLRAVESGLIEDALRRCQGQVGEVCQVLGLPQATLYRRLKALGLRAEDYRTA